MDSKNLVELTRMYKITRERGQVLVEVPTSENMAFGGLFILVGLAIFLLMSIHAIGNPSFAPLPLGFALIWGVLSIPIFLLRTKSKYMIADQKIRIKRFLLAPGSEVGFDKDSQIKLVVYEQSRGKGGTVTMWEVRVSNSGHEESIAKEANHLSIRELAEALCKAARLPLLDSSDHSRENIVISPEDLDLSFKERFEKYPEIMGKDYPFPKGSEIKEKTLPGKIRIFISPLLTGQVFLFTVFFAVAVLAYSFFPGKHEATSVFADAVRSGNFTFYYILFALLCLVLVVFKSISYRLILDPQDMRYSVLFFKFPISSSTISNREIEDVTSFQDRVDIISNQKVISFPDFSAYGHESSLWLSHEIRKQLSNEIF